MLFKKNKKSIKNDWYEQSRNSLNSQNQSSENPGAMFYDTGFHNSFPPLQPMKPIKALGRHVKAKTPQPKYSIGTSSANEPDFPNEFDLPANNPFVPQPGTRTNWSDRPINPNSPIRIKLPKRENTFNSASSSLFSSGSFGRSVNKSPQQIQKQQVESIPNEQPLQNIPIQQSFQPNKVSISKHKKQKNTTGLLQRLKNLIPRANPNTQHKSLNKQQNKTVKAGKLAIAQKKAVSLKNKAVQGTKKLATRIKNKVVSMKRKIYKPNQFRYKQLQLQPANISETS